MYKINLETSEILRGMKNTYYAEKLGKTPVYISYVLNGKKCSEIVAKGILSVYFNVGLNDIKIQELLDKFFIKEEEN